MKKILLIVFSFSIILSACAQNYFVSTTGSDENRGTFQKPFKTIQYASKFLKAGDTCFIREGVYLENVVVNKLTGKEAKNIVFTAYNIEEVSLTGAVPIESKWEIHKGNIYKTKLEQPIWQLFVEGKSMITARWPNGNWYDGSVWDKTKSMCWPEKENSILGNYYNKELKNLNFSLEEGGLIIVNSGSFKTYKAFITEHKAGSNNFHFDPSTVKVHFSYVDRVEKHGYFLEGKKELIDVEEEWFFEPKDSMLYLFVANGENPNNLNIEGKIMSYALEFSNSSFIEINDINFFGTTFNFKDCHNIKVENCDLLYPAYSKRMLRDISPMDATKMLVKNEYTPAHYEIINCTFAYLDGPAMELNGLGNLIENCYMHDIDYSCTYAGGYTLNMINATELIFRHNTIHTTGTSETFKAGRRNIIEYNDISNTGFLQNDGSMVQISVKQQDKSQTRFNWVHNSVKQGLRFDNSNLPNSPWGQNGSLYHNVAWKTDRIFFKGDNHFIYNNLIFDSHLNDLIISSNTDIAGFNYKTITRNNISNKFSGHRTKPGKDHPVPGIVDHNWSGNYKNADVRTQLRDPDNLDFRPKAGSEIIDAGALIEGKKIDFLGEAPDIGPYEFGDENYWIPGYQAAQARTPVPPNASTTVKNNADLMWLKAYKTDTHNVYFGSDLKAVEQANENSQEFAGTFINNIFDPGNLESGNTYYWRVDAVGKKGIVNGEVWWFIVGDD